MDPVERWEARGAHVVVRGHRIFTLEHGTGSNDPIVVLHGFPSCSFDWRHVLDALAADRRVVLFDLLGYGLSDKPDRAYSLFDEADIAQELIASRGVERCTLVTHDVGDSVGGELMARSLDGTLPFEIGARVITNGSIYMDLVQLSAGQQLMLALPDGKLAADSAPGEELFRASWAATFAAASQPSEEELAAQWRMLSRDDGHRLMPRLIRYVEERRIHEGRWTGAVEKHPAPLRIVWGDADPIAVYAMAERLAAARPDATLARLEGVGHYPMIEAPAAFAEAALA